MATLLEHMRDHLAALGVVRDPRVAGAAPPMWVDPRHGVPAPGEGQHATEIGPDAVLGAFYSGGIPPGVLDGWHREDTVDIWIRVRTTERMPPLEKAIRDVLHPPNGLNLNWTMAGLRVISSQVWRAVEPFERDDQGFTYIVAYLFETYAT